MRDNVTVRLRTDDDIPALIKVLEGQQPESRYPLRWPLPFPVEDFIQRPNEEICWVAELDGRVVGHVSITTVEDDEIGRAWATAAQTDLAGIACVSVLFVGRETKGLGVGGRLLESAVDWSRSQDRVPVLDVVQRHGSAVAVYQHRGWQTIGEARPAWLPDEEPPVLLMILPAPADAPPS